MARNPGGRPGRPSRGPRHTFHVLLPKEHHLLYVAESERRGMGALSDYICARLADLHGLEVPGYIQATLPALAVLPGWSSRSWSTASPSARRSVCVFRWSITCCMSSALMPRACRSVSTPAIVSPRFTVWALVLSTAPRGISSAPNLCVRTCEDAPLDKPPSSGERLRKGLRCSALSVIVAAHPPQVTPAADIGVSGVR